MALHVDAIAFTYIYGTILPLRVLVPTKGPSVCGKISGSTSFGGALLMFWYKFIPEHIRV